MSCLINKNNNQPKNNKLVSKNQRLLSVMKKAALCIKNKYSLTETEVDEILRECYIDMIAA